MFVLPHIDTQYALFFSGLKGSICGIDTSVFKAEFPGQLLLILGTDRDREIPCKFLLPCKFLIQ